MNKNDVGFNKTVRQVEKCTNEAIKIIDSARKIYPFVDPPQCSIRFSNEHVAQPMMCLDKEIYETVTQFCLRYNSIPIVEKPCYDKEAESLLINKEISIINSMRPILLNKNDSTYFQKVFGAIITLNKTSSKNNGLTINFFDEDNKSIDELILGLLKAFKKIVAYEIKNSDFDFIYNGVLQHSDNKFLKRRIQLETSDELQYVYLKNMVFVEDILNLLSLPYKIFRHLLSFGLLDCELIGNKYFHLGKVE